MSKDAKSELKEMLKAGRVKGVLDQLLEITKEDRFRDIEDEAFGLSRRYDRNEHARKIEGTINQEEYSLELNKIESALLKVVNSLPDDYKVTSAAEQVGKEEEQSLRFQLNSLVKDIIDVNGVQYEMDLVPPAERDLYYYRKSGYLNEKRTFLASQAFWVMEKIPNMVSDKEYNIVARSLYSAFDIFNSEKYYQKAIEVSKEEFNKIFNIRSYADFLYLVGRNPEGADQYKKALQLLPSSNDYSRAINGYTYQMWFVNETMSGNTDEAQNIYNQAKQEYESITSTGSRNHWLHSLLMEWNRLMPPDTPAPAS